MIVDTIDIEIEHPKKQRNYYNGKHQVHTLKTQVMHYYTGQILSVAYTTKTLYNLKLLKRTLKALLRPVRILDDKEYQGLPCLGIPCVFLDNRSLSFGRRNKFCVDGTFGWNMSLHD